MPMETPYYFVRLKRPPDAELESHSLDTLPAHRQRVLLWRVARKWARNQLEAWMPEVTSRPCRPRPYEDAWYEKAVPGDDGLFHLWHSEQGMVCGDGSEGMPGPWLHRKKFNWKDFNGRRKRRTYEVHTYRAGSMVQAPLAHPDFHCWRACSSWPEWLDLRKPRARARWWFVERLGLGCAVCGGVGVANIDHDPFTGLVRGMLCDTCNNEIDLCPHASGCRWADYLNDPPAGYLQAEYPGLGEKYRRTLERLEAAVEEWDPDLFADLRCRNERRRWQEKRCFTSDC